MFSAQLKSKCVGAGDIYRPCDQWNKRYLEIIQLILLLTFFFVSFYFRIYDLEKSLHTPLKFLFPNFETTNWFAGRSILKKIRGIL